jgi:alpha-D-ribose 1-methylphosphonate 5-triphosphate synthase subunit PhnG
MPNRTRVIPFALALSLSTAVVLADSKIEYKATEGGGSSLSTILIGQGKIRADADQNTSVIIDPTASQMTILDHGKKTFTRIGKAELQQMTDMLKQLEGMMASLPPEARQMMQGRMGGGGAPAAVTEDTGERATVAGKSCRLFRTSIQGRPTAEHCMADASVLDLPAADRETMAAAMAWSKELTDALAKMPMARLSDASPFRAGLMPLRSTKIGADGTRRTSELAGVTHSVIAGDAFAVPDGYKEQKMEIPKMGRGGF